MHVIELVLDTSTRREVYKESDHSLIQVTLRVGELPVPLGQLRRMRVTLCPRLGQRHSAW